MSNYKDAIIKKSSLATVNVIYYLPDYNNLINEFIWQTYDIPPQFLRVHRFLDYWRYNIEANIKQVQLAYVDPFDFSTRLITDFYDI